MSSIGISIRPGVRGIIAVITLSGAVYCFSQFLQTKPESIRMPLAAAEIKTAEGLAVICRVPEALRSRRWHRTGVRVWEDGVLLPLRVEDRLRVIRDGTGQLFVENEFLWFSSLDGSNPAVNGKRYELEVSRPSFGYGAAMAAVSGLGLFLFLVFPGLRGAVIYLGGPNGPLAGARKITGLICGLLALFFLLQMIPRWSFHRELPISSGLLFQKTEGQFCYYLPRWITNDRYRVESVVMMENQKALPRVSQQALKSGSAKGGFIAEFDYLQFRPADSSNPTTNGRVYGLKIPVWPGPRAFWLALMCGSAVWLLLFQWSHSSPAFPANPLGRKLVWWGAVLAVSLGKLCVINGDDIMAAEADASIYAYSAVHLIWGGSNPLLPSHPSGFPLVAGLVAQLGIPWRLALESFYLCACYFLARSINFLVRSRLVAWLLFMLMAWHPWTLSGFRDFMSEPLVLVLLISLLAAMFRMMDLKAEEWKFAFFAFLGLGLFFWDWCRHEDPLVYASYAYFVVLLWLVRKNRGSRPAKSNRRLVLWLALPALTVFSGSIIIKCVNHYRFGIYAKSLIHSPGLTALMKALYRVKPEQEIRYAPVTRQSLQAACEVSPSLKPFEAALLNPQAFATQCGEMITKHPGEFGSFLNWLLPQSLPADRRLANKVMLKAAEEINTALRSEKLPRRTAFFPWDPNWRPWISELPRCWLKWLKKGVLMAPASEPWGTFHKPILQDWFDQAANRRAAVTYPHLLLAQGLISAPPASIDSVGLTDQEGIFLGASPLFTNSWDKSLVFDIRAFLEKPPANYHLILFQGGKARHTVELTRPSASATGGLPSPPMGLDPDLPRTARVEVNTVFPDTRETVQGHVELSWGKGPKKARKEWWENWLATNYGGFVWFSLVVVALRILFGGRWEGGPLLTVFACFMLACGWMMGRAVFYGLLDANMGWESVRYMRCISPVFIVVLTLATLTVTVWVRRLYDGK